ncbi:MAG: hypothetical protein AAGF12_12690 [Myxococcota bacterium]
MTGHFLRVPLVRFLIAAILAFAAPLATPAEAQPDVRDFRPLMMLGVDTSGSMERLPDCVCTSASCTNCNPNCGSADLADRQNRWGMVVQALTGSFPTYQCTEQNRSIYVGEPDENYFIPHFELDSATIAGQIDDGIMDNYRDRVRWALTTFDGVPTLTTANLLSAYPFTAAQQTDSLGPAGDYSYADDREWAFPNCPFNYVANVGMQNETPPGGTGVGQVAGNLVSFGAANDYSTINDTIQNSLISLRPFGPTPIAGLLDDWLHYFDNHPDVATVTTVGGAGDPFAACRNRYAILLTDGYPNADFRSPIYSIDGSSTCATQSTLSHSHPDGTGWDDCPYDTPENIASELCDWDGTECTSGIVDGVFIVGFNVSGDPTTVTFLNDLADAGGTGTALFADNVASLRTAIADILDRTAPSTTTRTAPAFGTPSTATSGFQINSGFVLNTTPGAPWGGNLVRRRFACSGTGPTLTSDEVTVDASDRFHEVITNQTQNLNQRRVYTVAPDPANVRGWLSGDGAAELSAAGFPVPTGIGAGPVETGLNTVPFDDPSLTAAHFNVTTAAELTALQDYHTDGINLDGTDRFNVLGDIYHSSPVVMDPPLFDREDQSFNEYRLSALPSTITPSERPSVIYVGTNDGNIRAILTQDDIASSLPAGSELWSFVPPYNFLELEGAATNHSELVDGTPVVKEMFQVQLPGGAAGPDHWRTILIIGLRGGGAAYLALDVTDPIDARNNGPKFLWQFTLPNMGNAYGTPALAQVRHNTNGTENIRAVAILPGGTGNLLPGACAADQGVNGAGRALRRCWDPQGRSLHIMDLASGRLIKSIDQTTLTAPMDGGVAIYPGDLAAITNRAFMSDSDGMLWRLDLASSDDAQWEMHAFYDFFHDLPSDEAQPSFGPPVVSLNDEGDVVILQGTGDVDVLDGTVPGRVVSLTEQVAFDGSGNYDPATDVSLVVNWEETLNSGELVTGPIELFDGRAYWATFDPALNALNACDVGQSRLWGKEYITGNGAFEIPVGSGTFVDNIPFTDQIVLGVGVTQRPICTEEIAQTDPYRGTQYLQPTNITGGGFQLVAQTSGGGASVAGSPVNEINIDLDVPAAGTEIRSRVIDD